MNSKILLIIVGLCSIYNNLQAQKPKNFFPAGTYHRGNSNIHGISVGMLTEPDKLSNTNGIKIEGFGVGIFLAFAPRSLAATSRQEYDSVMRQPLKGRINGLAISVSGTYCDCKTNGVSLGYVAQWNRIINGFSTAGAMNYANRHNGAQIAGLYNGAYIANGLQLSVQNHAQLSNGIQIGIYNNSATQRGLQIGLFNKARQHRGLQLGIWNVNGKRKMPFINWNI